VPEKTLSHVDTWKYAKKVPFRNYRLWQGWANHGPPGLAETPTHVEFYETFTIFIKTWNFMKIVYVSVLTITV